MPSATADVSEQILEMPQLLHALFEVFYHVSSQVIFNGSCAKMALRGNHAAAGQLVPEGARGPSASRVVFRDILGPLAIYAV